MKILHSADWHLDSPLVGFSDSQKEDLRRTLLRLPEQIAALCRREQCDLMLLSGDLFDGAYTHDSYQAVYRALEEAAVPVFISPGNHDYVGADSPWQKERWPKNVHVFTQPHMESVELTQPKCRVWGAGYTAMDAPAMLEDFHAGKEDVPNIGILHGDPTQVNSPYCPVTKKQVQDSGLAYLALGHIHKQGVLRAGDTLCGWPGCPMGRGYDELGEKGVLLVTLEQTASVQFLPLDTPRFYDLEVEAGEDAALAVAKLLPAAANEDFYRITLTGPSEPVDFTALSKAFAQFPNLTLRDRTTPPVDLWASAGQDTLEGVYFGMLQQAMEGQDETTCATVRLAAKLSRQLLLGQEVKLP